MDPATLAPSSRAVPVRTRYVLTGDGEPATDRTVFCPGDRRAVSLQACAACDQLEALPPTDATDARVYCRSRSAGFLLPARADVRECATRTRLCDFMKRDVSCVRANASVAAVRALLRTRDLRCLPVVDDSSRLIGILAKSDLFREGEARAGSEMPPSQGTLLGRDLEEQRRAGEVMTPRVHALPEDAPLVYAISLMAFERLHEVPVVDSDDRVVGVVTALEIVRWLAGEIGYVLTGDAPIP